MDDFDLRDLLAPPMQYRSDLPAARHQNNECPPLPQNHPPLPQGCGGILAMASVPSQRWEELYSPEEGLPRGTIFRMLDLPFQGGSRHE